MKTFIPKKILVIRPDALGDCLLITPALKLIKEKYPECYLAVLVKEYTRPIFENNRNVDEIILDRIKDARRFAAFLKRKRFDTSLHFYNEFSYAYLAWRLRIKHRIGDRSKPLVSWLYNHRIDQKYNNLTLHIVEQNCRFLEPMGIKVSDPPPLLLPLPSVTPPLQIQHQNNLVGLHLGTGGGNKPWLAERFAKVIDALEERGYRVVITGDAKEESAANRIMNLCPRKPLNLVKQTTLAQLMVVISQLKVYAGVDTGPLHMAAALGIPVITLSPSRLVKPSHWGPWKTRNIVIRKPADCPPIKCQPRNCPFDDCVKNITPEDVTKAILKVLHQGGNTDLVSSKEDWLKKSLNILTNREEVFRELNIHGYHAVRLDMVNNLFELVRLIIKEDINVIHWVGKTRPPLLWLASKVSPPWLPLPARLIMDGDLRPRSCAELIELYKRAMA